MRSPKKKALPTVEDSETSASPLSQASNTPSGMQLTTAVDDSGEPAVVRSADTSPDFAAAPHVYVCR